MALGEIAIAGPVLAYPSEVRAGLPVPDASSTADRKESSRAVGIPLLNMRCRSLVFRARDGERINGAIVSTAGAKRVKESTCVNCRCGLRLTNGDVGNLIQGLAVAIDNLETSIRSNTPPLPEDKEAFDSWRSALPRYRALRKRLLKAEREAR